MNYKLALILSTALQGGVLAKHPHFTDMAAARQYVADFRNEAWGVCSNQDQTCREPDVEIANESCHRPGEAVVFEDRLIVRPEPPPIDPAVFVFCPTSKPVHVKALTRCRGQCDSYGGRCKTPFMGQEAACSNLSQVHFGTYIPTRP
ncbi:hypothetical protein Purlil1_5060 [Purpureocillium lilacinum]|uniref:Uncharacterized protein n=1 Tax=Purpureocillium lilacinum TaxID=33203 RepID=A0ABR0C207_PURLI|nr:hypothetical protein Purlil1_5060 [Purpureocillium lilacinum]